MTADQTTQARTLGSGSHRGGMNWLKPLRKLRLRTRLTLLVISTAIPLLLGTNIVLVSRAENSIRENIDEQLRLTNEAVSSRFLYWFDNSEYIVKLLSSSTDITSMDSIRQREVLVITSQSFPSLTLVHTINQDGLNIARSDNAPVQNYSDTEYFKNAILGEPLTVQVVQAGMGNQPYLAMSAPIYNMTDAIVGVVSIVSNFEEISKAVLASVNQTGSFSSQIYLVDSENRVVVHSDPRISAQMADYTDYQPVYALRKGQRGIFEFVDNEGEHWLAFLSATDNGWGVITQYPIEAALAPVYEFRRVSWWITAGAVIILAALSVWLIDRSIHPIRTLTNVASAIAAGDLSQEVKIYRADEVGELALAFNSMTAQLRDSINTLEKRVSDRTRVVETTAVISRRLSMILDQGQLVREVVNQLQLAFGYYHVHIYLYDVNKEYLIMVGGTGEAGREMLARGHKLGHGKGLVGLAAQTRDVVLIRNTPNEPQWLPNPLLPETKSEIAVPIIIGDDVLGVLDVQHDQVGGLNRSDAEMLQSVANQVAIAVQNARAFTQAQRQAEREALAANIGLRIQQMTTVEDILRVAVGELGQALGASKAAVEVSMQSSTEPQNKVN